MEDDTYHSVRLKTFRFENVIEIPGSRKLPPNSARYVRSMAIHRNSPQSLQLLMLFVGCFGVEATETFFYREPFDVKHVLSFESNLSYTYVLPCVVGNLVTGENVAWYKDGIQISNGYTINSNFKGSNRYMVNVFTTSTQSAVNLKITTSVYNAALNSGYYYCRVLTTPPLVSRNARFDVFFIPQYGYLQCSIDDYPDDDVFNVNEGIEIRLSCRSNLTGVPEMTTYWTRIGSRGDTIDTVKSTSTDNHGSRVRSFSWTPTNQENGVTFICTGFHPGYSTSKSCQLGPFNVLYRPIVQLSPSFLTVTIEHQVMTFTCISDANPPVTRYVWSHTAGEKFSLQGDNVIVGPDGKWMKMNNFRSQDNGVYYVTCYAENEFGRSLVNGTSTLTVNIQASTTVKTVGEQLRTATSKLTSTWRSVKNKTVIEDPRTVTRKTMGEHLSTATRKTVSEHFSTATRKTVSEYLSTATSTLTATSSKGNEHIPSDGQHEMTSVTQVGASTSYYDGINKTAKASQTVTIIIIISAVGGCNFIFAVICVVWISCTMCVRKSRKKSPKKVSVDSRESADTNSNILLYDDIANINSPYVVNQSQYSTVDQTYEIINDDGNTSNVDSTCVEFTAQAGVLFKNTSGNRGDAIQSLVESRVVRVRKQGKSTSHTTAKYIKNKKTETNPANPSQYPTVDQAYEIVNGNGNTFNVDPTSVEMTAQTGVLFKNTDGSRGDTIQSLVEPSVVRVGIQRKAVSPITAEDTENKNTQTSDGIYVINEDIEQNRRSEGTDQ